MKEGRLVIELIYHKSQIMMVVREAQSRFIHDQRDVFRLQSNLVALTMRKSSWKKKLNFLIFSGIDYFSAFSLKF